MGRLSCPSRRGWHLFLIESHRGWWAELVELSEIHVFLPPWLEDELFDACDEPSSLTSRILLSEEKGCSGVLRRRGRREISREVPLPVLGSTCPSTARVQLLELMAVMHMVTRNRVFASDCVLASYQVIGWKGFNGMPKRRSKSRDEAQGLGVGEKRTCMCDEDPVPPSFGAAPSIWCHVPWCLNLVAVSKLSDACSSRHFFKRPILTAVRTENEASSQGCLRVVSG